MVVGRVTGAAGLVVGIGVAYDELATGSSCGPKVGPAGRPKDGAEPATGFCSAGSSNAERWIGMAAGVAGVFITGREAELAGENPLAPATGVVAGANVER
jgi:hypothetical protein